MCEATQGDLIKAESAELAAVRCQRQQEAEYNAAEKLCLLQGLQVAQFHVVNLSQKKLPHTPQLTKHCFFTPLISSAPYSFSRTSFAPVKA